MDEIRVVLNDATRVREQDLPVRLGGPEQNFTLRIDRIERRLSQELDDHALDFLEIAAAVFAADSLVSRGGRVRQHFGERWRRSFHFVCPVRRLDLWSQPRVREALEEAVSFMTDDRAVFEFVESNSPPRPEAYLPFHDAENAEPLVDEVVMFSGGLDSLAGALERLSSGTGRIALVAHQSAPKVKRRQEDLVKALQQRFPGRIRWIPVEATKKGVEERENTQRSRPLLFTALGYAVARMTGAGAVDFFENGVVSANLPIARQIIGSMATRTTHPLTLRRLDELLATLPGDRVTPRNGYAWLTKTEVVSKLAAFGGEDLIDMSISCTNVYNRSNTFTHCGGCSQCLDRRFGLIAAGLGGHDDAGHYETEVMTGARETVESRTMAAAWTSHALEMPADEVGFYSRFGSEMPRLVDGYPDRTEVDVVNDIIALHQRHSESAASALKIAIENASADLAGGRVAETSLLRMIIGRRDADAAAAVSQLRDHEPPRMVADEPSGRTAARPDADPPWPAQINVVSETGEARVDLLGLLSLKGPGARLVIALRARHAEDSAAARPRATWGYVDQDELLDGMGLTDAEHLRQIVRRVRGAVSEALTAMEIAWNGKFPLIQNKPRSGYRLDPDARFVDPEEG